MDPSTAALFEPLPALLAVLIDFSAIGVVVFNSIEFIMAANSLLVLFV
jgi:hypothetical protein